MLLVSWIAMRESESGGWLALPLVRNVALLRFPFVTPTPDLISIL